jgi:predicted flap endonuclease-1-like 5' DNA nuclease
MSVLIILLAQTKSGAIIEILLLLMVAAIIGYMTSWLYYKSIYKKRIKVLESERHEFNNHIINMNADVSNLKRSLGEKHLEIEYLKMDVNALKALHKEAVNETDDMNLKMKRAEKLLYEQDETLAQLLNDRYLLDYKSFGIATEAEKDDLKMISGIGPLIEGRLHTLDIFTFRQISKFTPRDIEAINKAIIYFSGRIEKDEWVAQAKELLKSEEKRLEFLEKIRKRKALIQYNRIGIAKIEEADDLTVISGIGGWIKEKLNALDIYTFKQISNFTKDDVQTVTEAIEYFPGRIERDEWILQAGELVQKAGEKAELLKNIERKKELINFDRIGIAYLHQANNLTLINGIGIWSEERLNMLGIYTFEQISRLTSPDVKIIAEILNISPDRIDKHKWIEQAGKLVNNYMSTTMFIKN